MCVITHRMKKGPHILSCVGVQFFKKNSSPLHQQFRTQSPKCMNHYRPAGELLGTLREASAPSQFVTS